MLTAGTQERLDLIKRFDLTNLQDADGNGVNLIVTVRAWVSMLLDSPIGSYKSDGLLKRELRLFSMQYEKQVRFYAKLADKLASSIITDDLGDYVCSLHDDFKRTPVFAEYHSWYKTGDTSQFQFLLSYLLFGKKAVFHNPALITEAAEKWEKNEEHLSRRVLPAHVVEDLRRVIAESRLRLDPEEFFPGFGPGTVSDKKIKGLTAKAENLRYLPELDSYLDLLVRSLRETVSWGRFLPDLVLWEKGRRDFRHASVEFSERLFVDKDIGSVRTIFREPNVKMYFQQGVLRMFKRSIETSIYGKIITLEDQSHNQKVCVRGSQDGDYSTIDLSAASDLVAEDLVAQIFDEQTLVHFYATRTMLVKLDDEYRCTYRFAGMGSAVCFPLQCVVFASVLALSNHLHDRGTSYTSYMEKAVPVFKGRIHFHDDDGVYGDDITCGRQQTEALVSLLTDLGFIVNLDKSFYGAKKLRESCGVYALHGEVVTPLRMKVKGLEYGDVHCVDGMIDMVNRSFGYKYYHLRQMLLDHIPYDRYIIVSETNPYKGPSYVYWVENVTPENPKGRKIPFRTQDGIKLIESRMITVGGQTYRAALRPVTKILQHASVQRDQYLLSKWLHDPSISEKAKPSIGDSGKTELRWVWMPT